jgi:hypothetical protein
MTGWFRIWRELLEKELWLTEPFTRGQAFVDLIGLANHADGFIRVRGNRVEVKRGQCGWSEVKLAERWKWSRGRIRRFLSELQNDDRIVQQKNRITSVISLKNYDKYQGDDTADSTTDGQQTDNRQYTNKKEKKEKKEKKVGVFTPPTPAQVDQYAQSIGYHRSNLGRDFCQKYEATGWRIKGGKPMDNWKLAVQTWRKMDEKNPPRNEGSITVAPIERGADGLTPRERVLGAAT